MSENQFSLSKCAELDALKYGSAALDELKRKRAYRKANKRKGIKTNVGDPINNRKGSR